MGCFMIEEKPSAALRYFFILNPLFFECPF